MVRTKECSLVVGTPVPDREMAYVLQRPAVARLELVRTILPLAPQSDDARQP